MEYEWSISLNRFLDMLATVNSLPASDGQCLCWLVSFYNPHQVNNPNDTRSIFSFTMFFGFFCGWFWLFSLVVKFCMFKNVVYKIIIYKWFIKIHWVGKLWSLQNIGMHCQFVHCFQYSCLVFLKYSLYYLSI